MELSAITAAEQAPSSATSELVFHGIADDWTGHAVTAPTAPAQFAGADGDDFHASLAQQGVGVSVAVIADHHARFQADHVVAIVPLLAFGGEAVAAGLDNAQFLQAQGLGDDGHEVLLFTLDVDAVGALLVRAQGEGNDLFHHFREDSDQVAVAEAEHGIQMHRGAGLGQAGDNYFLGSSFGEQRLGDLANGLAGGALAHADQDDAVADGHDVTTFEGGHAVVLVRIAVPDFEVGVDEFRVELVDRGGQQGFLTSCRPVHRVQGHTAVDPAGGVTSELGVGQRRQQEAGVAEVVAVHLQRLGAFAFRDVVGGHATDEELGQFARLQAFQPGAQLVGQADADAVSGDLAIEDPLQGFGVRHDVGQQVVHFQNIDAAFAHLGDEVEVVALRLVHPDNVVEQQLVAVARGQALMGESGRADHHFA